MEKPPRSVLAHVLGASSAFAGLVLAAPCGAGSCLGCLRCASVTAGLVIATLLFRSAPGREERPSTLPSKQAQLPAK